MAEDKEKKTEKVKRLSPLKRDIQNERRRLANRSFKAEVNTAIRNLQSMISKGDATASKEHLATVCSLMDKGIKTGVFKLNKANRTKSRLAKTLPS